jgi:hypothetical protein
MASTDLHALERRVRRQYEWARVRRSVLGFSPALVVVAAAALYTKRPGSAAVFGAAMFAAGVLLLWYGRDLRRAVLPGLALGVLPLVLTLCVNHFHHCSGGVCVSWCVPACSAGGLAAGIGVAIVGHRTRRSLGYWAGASALTLLTGAMGCSCVGYSGIVGLVAGYAVGLAPALLRSFVSRKSR